MRVDRQHRLDADDGVRDIPSIPALGALCEILLAEDNAADVVLVREALKTHGVRCALHVIRDGAQAISFLETIDHNPQEPPLDLVLLDLHLPKHDGEDILKRLRSTEHYARTPVVVMTSLDASFIEEKRASDATLVFFQKPLSLDGFMELGSIVRRVLAPYKNPS